MKCGKPARSPKAFYCEDHRTDLKTETSQPQLDGLGEAEAGDLYAERVPTEPKPQPESKGVFGKLWGNKEPKPEPPPSTTERKPAAPKKRVSTAPFWSDLVTPAAAIAGRSGYVPMARAMVWTAPVVGEIVEDATKGTMADRLVQPFVRNAQKWEDLWDLLGFWAAVGMAQRNPAQAQASLDFARKRFVNLLPRIASNIKKERAKERQAVEALTELMPDIRELFPDAGPDDDPVTLLIQSLFAAPESEPVGVS
jgi:hypothetical protein